MTANAFFPSASGLKKQILEAAEESNPRLRFCGPTLTTYAASSAFSSSSNRLRRFMPIMIQVRLHHDEESAAGDQSRDQPVADGLRKAVSASFCHTPLCESRLRRVQREVRY
jgi:hypothetical protein